MQKQEELITIKKIGGKENKFWIQDTLGEYYSGFKEYQGIQNTEYAQLLFGNHNEPFKEGDQALVSFTKTVGNDNKIYKNLKGIYPADTRPKSAVKAKSDATELGVMSTRTPEYSEPKRNWDREAYEKCCSIWAAADLEHGRPIEEIITGMVKGAYWDLFQAIRKDGEKRFATGMEKARINLGIPAHQPTPSDDYEGNTVSPIQKGMVSYSDDYEAGNRAIEEAQMVEGIGY